MTEALTKNETATLLALVREQGLSVSQLACEFSRQQSRGHGVSSPLRGVGTAGTVLSGEAQNLT